MYGFCDLLKAFLCLQCVKFIKPAKQPFTQKICTSCLFIVSMKVNMNILSMSI